MSTGTEHETKLPGHDLAIFGSTRGRDLSQNSVSSKSTISNKIRASLAPSFIERGRHESPPPTPVASTFKPGHRRVPTALRSIPPIHLHESEDEAAQSDCSAASSRPASPVVVAEGRELPVWIPVPSQTDSGDDEPTITIDASRTSGAARRRSIIRLSIGNPPCGRALQREATLTTPALAVPGERTEGKQLKHKRSRSALSNLLSPNSKSRPGKSRPEGKEPVTPSQVVVEGNARSQVTDKKEGLLRWAVNKLRK